MDFDDMIALNISYDSLLLCVTKNGHVGLLSQEAKKYYAWCFV